MAHDEKAVSVTLVDRAKYFASAAVSAGVGLEMIGAGGVGLLLAGGAGAAAAYFSPEIRGFLFDRMPAPEQATSRKEKLKWWLTGEQDTDEGQSLPSSESDPIDEMEPLQPIARPDVQSLLPRRSPTFAQMRHLITPERDILGFDGQQFIYAESLKQSVNFAMIGVPHSGKTTALAFHTAQAIMRGAIVRGWDLHGDVAADLGGVLHILEDADEIVADCAWIQAERERRLTLRKRARAGERNAAAQWAETRELFYIIDEFNALMLRLKRSKKEREFVTDTLLSLIAEGRKLKMRVIITGQTMPAALFGDQGSSARDIISTKYALQSREDHAQYFGIESSALKSLLPLIAGEDSAGYAVLDGGPLLHAKLVSIPYTTVEDIRALIEQYGGYESEEEDDLMDYITSRRNSYEREERETDPVIQAPRYHSHATGRDAQWQRRAEREQRLRGAGVARGQAQPLSPELQRAYDAFEDGMSYRDLGAILGVGKDTAGKWCMRLKERGYISETGQRRV